MIKSRRIRWAGRVERIEDRRGVYRILAGKPERKCSLGRPRNRWGYNVNIDRQEVLCWGYGLDRSGSG